MPAVTPCVGVWIETNKTYLCNIIKQSHPAWVCGLKQIIEVRLDDLGRHTLRGCVD